MTIPNYLYLLRSICNNCKQTKEFAFLLMGLSSLEVHYTLIIKYVNSTCQWICLQTHIIKILRWCFLYSLSKVRYINGIPLHYRIQWRISPFPGLIKGGCIWSLRNPSSYNCFTQHVYVTRMEKAVSAKNVLKKTNFQTLALHECKELLTFNINTYINTYINT